MIDFKGLRFGKLIVLGRSHTDKWRVVVWLCLCDCGNKTTADSKALNKGKKKSCGCLYNRPLKERLMERVIKDKNGCWIWGKGDKNNYGKIMIAGRKTLLMHRVSYEIYRGSIPKGMCVCHKCDNPPLC